MKEESVFKMIDGIANYCDLDQNICESLQSEEKINIEKIRANVLGKIKTKKKLKFYKLRVAICLTIIVSITITFFSIRGKELIDKAVRFIPGLGFILHGTNESSDYLILQEQIEVSNPSGNAIIKSAFLQNNKLIIRIECNSSFMNINEQIRDLSKNSPQDKKKLYNVTDKLSNYVSLMDNNKEITPVEYAFTELSDVKILYEFRFDNIINTKSRTTFTLKFYQTEEVTEFNMIAYDLFAKSKVYENIVNKNGLELLVLAIRYKNTIEAEIFTKYNGNKIMSRVGMPDDRVKLKDNNGFIYYPDTEWVNYGEFYKDINKKVAENESEVIYNPSYHCSFTIKEKINFPIKLEVPYLAFTFLNSEKNEEVWLELDIPPIGQSYNCNIKCKLPSINMLIKEVKRNSYNNVEITMESTSSSKNKLIHINAYTFLRYDEKIKANRQFKILEYNNDMSIKRLQIEIDPESKRANILFSNPEIAYYGPWEFDIANLIIDRASR